MASIQPIEGRSVHRIQSGQVIVDLCSVVKELVENSLDAGATSIDVRFKSHGLDTIEVQDNGSGIAKEDYESIGLKHYTSKLRAYEDLSELQTFGFRGEALSSLCALSDVHILTVREDEAPKGSRLDFEASGKLKGIQVVAAQRGTTVAVETIFKNLPVRRQELEKNIKREYGKVLNLLQAYACISAGVKISVSNVVGKKKTIVFSTKSNKTTRENIVNVFGAKTLSALTALELSFEMQSSLNLSAEENDQKQVKISGHVSKPIVGEGRQTPDRQMFFVNSRPCALPQVAKVMNEVYKNYNITQSPFIFANVMLNTNAYDVNVSPDKRTILLHDQGVLLESVKTSLTELFDDQVQTVPLSQAPTKRLPVQSLLPTMQSTQSTGEAVSQGTEDSSAGDEAEDADLESSEALNEPSSGARPDGLINQFLAQKTKERSTAHPRDGGTSNTFNAVAKIVNKKGDEMEAREQLPKSNNLSGIGDAAPDAEDVHVGGIDGQPTERQTVPKIHHMRQLSSEPEISSITTTPAKSSPGVVPNAFDRMRPIRTPSELATVTIGDKTTISRIGSPSMRWPYAPKSSRMRVIHPAKTSVTRFGSSLKAFAAAGTQDSISDEGEVSEDGDASIETRSNASTQESLQSSVEADAAVNKEVDAEDVESGVENDETDNENEDQEAENDEEENVMSSEGSDEEWLDEEAKKANEEAKVAKLIEEAEESLARPSEESERRARKLLKGGHRDATTKLLQKVDVSVDSIREKFVKLTASAKHPASSSLQPAQETSLPGSGSNTAADEAATAEERLSLTVSKKDFDSMRIVGQFNLGFIIAVRPPDPSCPAVSSDELFIIDQHASDEKYNFERLQATTVLQSQRLVRPQTLQLTAIEEETAIDHLSALQRNGYIITIADDTVTTQTMTEDSPTEDLEDTTSAEPGAGLVGTRLTLHALPTHAFKKSSAALSSYSSSSSSSSPAFKDLDELLALLPENPHARPASVRKVLAMRACRSSVMVGKALSAKRMEGVVRHMGGMDKPWNCPHGRPTMRHLGGLGRLFPPREGVEPGTGCWVEGMGIVGTEEGGEENKEKKMAWDRKGPREVDWATWLLDEGVNCDEDWDAVDSEYENYLDQCEESDGDGEEDEDRGEE